MNDRHDSAWGEYAEVTNLEKLVAQAKKHAGECSLQGADDFRRCAEQAVREDVCFCATNEQHIIDALVNEVVRIGWAARKPT